MSTQHIRKALIVDEDGDIVAQARRILLRVGSDEIVECSSLSKARRLAASMENLDFAILDLSPTEIADIDPVLLFSSKRREKVTPFLIISDICSRQELAHLARQGFIDIVIKPINPSILERKVIEKLAPDVSIEQEMHALEQFHKLLREGKLARAKSIMLPLVKQFQQSPKYLTCYAELLFAAGDESAAQRMLNSALALDRSFHPALTLSSRFGGHQVGVNSEGASAPDSVTLESLVDAPMDATQLNLHATSLMKQGRFDEAVGCYQKSLAILRNESKRHLILYNIALAQFKRGDMQLSSDYCHKCIQLAPKEFEKALSLLAKITQPTRVDSLHSESSSTSAAPTASAPVVESIENSAPSLQSEENSSSATDLSAIRIDEAAAPKDEIDQAQEEFIMFIMFETN